MAIFYDKRDNIRGLIEAGKKAYGDKRYERAMSFLEEALVLSRLYKEVALIVSANSRIAIVHFYQKNYQESYNLLLESLSLAKAHNILPSIGDCLNKIGFFKANRGFYADAEIYHRSAANIYKECGMDRELGIAYLNIGYIHVNLDQYQLAQEYSLKAVKYSEAVNDWANLHKVYLSLASTKVNVKDFKGAMLYADKALELGDKMQSPDRILAAKSSKGLNYLEQDEFEKAIECLREVEMDPHFENFRKHIVLNNLGLAYFHKKEYPKAEAYLLRALAIREQTKDLFRIGSSYYHLATFYIKIESLDQANFYIQALDKLLQRAPNDKLLLQLFELKKDFYKQKKNYFNAFKYASFITEKTQEAFTSQLAKEISQKDAVYQTELKEREIEHLKSKRALEQNMMKDLHHRVKNYLNTFSSLLNMQHRKVEDQVSKDAFKEMELRAVTMAKLHRKLYDDPENSHEVKLYDYVHEIMESLLISFKKSNVSFDIDIPKNTFLGMDAAIPIGLIINELVVNSFKHAFEGNDGHINIAYEVIADRQYFSISDNGKGMPKDFNFKKSKSYGIKIIKTMVNSLKGEIESLEIAKGCKWKLSFPFSQLK